MFENTHTAQTTFVTFLYLKFFVTAITFVSQDFGFFFNPSVVRSLLFVSRFDILVGLVSSPCVVACPYHILTLRTSDTPVVLWLQKTYFFTVKEPKYR